MEIINQKLILAMHHINGKVLEQKKYDSTTDGFNNALMDYTGACSNAEIGEEISLYLEEGEDETAILRHYIK